MVNYDTLKAILEDDHAIIHDGDELTVEMIDLMRRHKINKVAPLFSVYSSPGKAHSFPTSYRCPQCGKVYKKTLNKGDLFQLLRKGYECEECLQKRCEELRRKSREQTTIYETNLFIHRYLLSEFGLKHKEEPELDFGSMLPIDYVDVNAVASRIRGMDYKEFLNTPYWKIIAAHKKKEAGWRCSLCGGSGHLSVHHRDYSHHGYEHLFLNDLVCLCSNCHEKFHDIIKGDDITPEESEHDMKDL